MHVVKWKESKECKWEPSTATEGFSGERKRLERCNGGEGAVVIHAPPHTHAERERESACVRVYFVYADVDSD